MIEPRREIGELALYVPGKSLSQARTDSGRLHIIKLASNESLWGPSPKALAAMGDALQHINYYPAVQDPELLDTLAQKHRLQRDEVIVGTGADEILRLLAVAYVRPGDEVLYPSPSFSAYRHSTLLAGGIPREVPLAPTGANDLEATLESITAKTRLVYLCSPNNPTGTAFSREAWDAYLARVPDTVITLVDGAYLEFATDRPDFLEAVRNGRPVVLARTFSKLYALAGIRVGWAAAPPAVVQQMMKAREPFSVNSLATAGARASLQDEAYFANVLKETQEARAYLTRALDERGYQYFAADANFVTMRVAASDAETAARLLNEGFVVRPTASFGLPQHIRITVAPIPILEEFLRALDRLAVPR